MLRMKRSVWLAGVALLALPLQGVRADENGQAKGRGGAARLKRLANREARIEKHIENLNARIAKHPNAPANIKADVQKLVDDLTAKKTTLEQVAADLQAHNKAAVKADHQEFKAERATTKTDRQTLKADRQAHKAARQGAKN